MLVRYLEHVLRPLEHASMLVQCLGSVIRILEHADTRAYEHVCRTHARTALARNTIR